MNLIRSFSVISFFTILSRIAGFARDILFASILGASIKADIFLLAYRIPNLFRRLYGEGVFHSAFIPIYIDSLKIKNLNKAIEFKSFATAYLIILLLVTLILGELFMRDIISFLAPGFSDLQIEETVSLAIIMFPYLVFISLASVFGAILNASGRFALWSFIPVLLNLFLIGSILTAFVANKEPGNFLSWGVFLAGLAQFLILAYWLNKVGLSYSLRIPRVSSNIKKLFYLMLPSLLAGGVIQINQMVGTIFASSIPGAISWLYYADRVAQLPLGIFGIAIATALLPILSQLITKKDEFKAKEQTDRAILFLVLFSFLSAAGLLTLSDLITDVLFRRGEFGYGDTLATSKAMMAYAIGLPAFALSKLLATIFFSRKDTKTPLYSSLFSMVINVILIFLLVIDMGHIGIALSLSISSWAGLVIMYFFSWKKNYWKIDYILFKKIIRIFLSTTLVILLIKIFYNVTLFYSSFFLIDFISKSLSLAFLIGVSTLIFIFLNLFFKVFNFYELKSIYNKKIKI